MSLVRQSFAINESTSFDCWVFVIRGVDGAPDEFWFKGDDVAVFLDYARPRKAISDHVDAVWRRTWSDIRGNTNQDSLSTFQDTLMTSPQDNVIASKWQPHTVFISELGLYALTTRSKKPEALKFLKWVNEDVLPSLRRNRTFTVGEPSAEPMDTTPTQHEVDLLKKELELQKLKSKLSKIDFEKQSLEKDLAVNKEKSDSEKQILSLEKDKQILSLEKSHLELHYKYTFQAENAKQMGRASIEQYVQRQVEREKHELMKTLISKNYRIMPNMDDVDPKKVNNIGIIYDKEKREYQIVRQQWENTLKSYDYIQRDASSQIELLDPSIKKRRYLRPNLVVQGDMIPVAHGVNMWTSYINQDLPHLFGMKFSESSFARFQILNETQLREHYEFYANRETNERYTDKLYRFYKNKFDKLKLRDADDCVAQCLSADIWQIRENLKEFISSNDIDSIETMSQSGLPVFNLDDAVSGLVATSIDRGQGSALDTMCDVLPKEAETLTWRLVCENQKIVKPSTSTGAIQNMAIETAQTRQSGFNEFREPSYTVQIPNSPPHEVEIADTVSVASSMDDYQQHLSRYLKDLTDKRQTKVDKYTK